MLGKIGLMSVPEEFAYEPNPKHKEPWQHGRKGTLCPKWSHLQSSVLLKKSIRSAKGNHRYATLRGVAFCGKEHRPGIWHGHPVGWEEVPPKIWRQWLKDGIISRKQIRDSWNEAKWSGDE